MATNKAMLVAIGLSFAATTGWGAASEQTVAADGQTPNAIDVAADAPDAQEQVLLLTNGRVIKGIVVKEGPDYTVTQRIGTMHFTKKQVEGMFASFADAFKYRLAQLPDGDCDEHMKLALWCMNLKMKAEAKEQLSKVIALNPSHFQAKAMLRSMQQAETLAAQRQRDPDVKQTAAGDGADERPGALAPAVIQGAQRERMISAVPEIFDLPLPLAVKRANEFYAFVHPALQLYCAKCHDERHAGKFQLVPIKARADRTPDAMRANLDATLRIIDPENPAKSELLTSVLRNHGNGPRARPIFAGSNDRTYQILASWARSLRSNQPKQEPAQAGSSRPVITEEEMFAAERDRTGSDPRGPAVPPRKPMTQPNPPAMQPDTPGIIPPPLRYRGSVDLSARPIDADPRELDFPAPPVLNGFKLPATPRRDRATKPAENTAKTATKTAPPAGTAIAAMPRATAAAGMAADPAKTNAAKSTPASDDAETAKKPAKPVKIDPKLLEKMLNRQ
jgi:hypothetical protein